MRSEGRGGALEGLGCPGSAKFEQIFLLSVQEMLENRKKKLAQK
jgi:hypothetical protein